MNSIPKVSIIVPVYNVEKYLSECLDSIVNQTLQEIEIIIINDGSTDTSPDIIDKYVQQDSRIRAVHQENGGYGKAMNHGLELAKGEYIGIVESDDYVELDMFEILYKKAKEYDLDIVRCHYYFYKSKERKNDLIDLSWIPQNIMFDPLKNPIPFYQAPAIWSAIYKRDMIESNSIRFLETPGASYQDTSFAFKTYACSRNFILMDYPGLHYRIDNESSSVNSPSKVFCVCEEFNEIERFIKTNPFLYNTLRKVVPRLKYGCYAWNHSRLSYPYKYKFLKVWSKELWRDLISLNISRKYFTKNEKITVLKIALFPFLFRKTKTFI